MNTTKYKNKYRIASARIPGYDYGNNGAYFITICTKNRVHFFGEIINGKLCVDGLPITPISSGHLNNGDSQCKRRMDWIGDDDENGNADTRMAETRFIASLPSAAAIALEIWFDIPKQFPFICLGEFVVMPNHIHGILIIDKTMIGHISESIHQTESNAPKITIEKHNEKGGITGKLNPMLHQNISRIVRWYKGRCSFEIRKSCHEFEWQSRFHDHIIRDPDSFERITQYIRDNPKKWDLDQFRSDHEHK